MADDIDITPGSGKTVRADEVVASKWTQVMRLDTGFDGDGELMGLGDSRFADATSAGLTTASTAYTAGDQLGTELSFTSIVRTGKGCRVDHAVLIDKAKIVGAVDLFLFDASVTPAADNAANAWSDADLAKLLGVIHFTDPITSANNIAVLPTNLPVLLKPTSGTTVYGHLVTRTGHTFFGATTDLIVRLGVARD